MHLEDRLLPRPARVPPGEMGRLACCALDIRSVGLQTPSRNDDLLITQAQGSAAHRTAPHRTAMQSSATQRGHARRPKVERLKCRPPASPQARTPTRSHTHTPASPLCHIIDTHRHAYMRAHTSTPARTHARTHASAALEAVLAAGWHRASPGFGVRTARFGLGLPQAQVASTKRSDATGCGIRTLVACARLSILSSESCMRCRRPQRLARTSPRSCAGHRRQTARSRNHMQTRFHTLNSSSSDFEHWHVRHVPHTKGLNSDCQSVCGCEYKCRWLQHAIHDSQYCTARDGTVHHIVPHDVAAWNSTAWYNNLSPPGPHVALLTAPPARFCFRSPSCSVYTQSSRSRGVAFSTTQACVPQVKPHSWIQNGHWDRGVWLIGSPAKLSQGRKARGFFQILVVPGLSPHRAYLDFFGLWWNYRRTTEHVW